MTAIGNNNLLKQQIKQHPDLPVLPPGIVTLLKALNNNDIHFDQLALELERFPSIAIKIVAIANSAWASPQMPVTNLPDACSRVGLNIVRSVSIALSISQVFDPSRCPAFNSKTYWTSALLNAEAAYICAKDNPEVNPNTARFAGLLHNIGLLWLANQKPVETESAILHVLENPDESLADALFDRLAMNYYTVGGLLAMVMELPEMITETISAETADGLNGEKPLISNHCYAKQLTASVLQAMEMEAEMDMDAKETITSNHNENPHYQKLTEMLPKIQSLAALIFPN
jgi:HD-like signal output (HDOD) protein